jgi:hypothetical protein
MAEFTTYQKLDFAFGQVLGDLSKSWSSADVAYVRDILAHAEYGEALENLIALGVGNGTTFDAALMAKLNDIGSAMGMDADGILSTARARHPFSATNAAA